MFNQDGGMARNNVAGMRHVMVDEAGMQVHNRRPSEIRGHDGLTWVVEEVVSYWDNDDAGGKPVRDDQRRCLEAVRWQLTVTGPLPGRPEVSGRQEVILTSFATGNGWWMGVAEHTPPPGRVLFDE